MKIFSPFQTVVLQASSFYKVKSSVKWEGQEAFPQLSALSHPPTPHIFVYCCVPCAVEADPKKYNIKFIILS